MASAGGVMVHNGEGAAEVADSLPDPPVLSGLGDGPTALATWHRVLDQDIRKILDETGPQPQQPVVTSPVREAHHAAV
jgi:hypothetical protein